MKKVTPSIPQTENAYLTLNHTLVLPTEAVRVLTIKKRYVDQMLFTTLDGPEWNRFVEGEVKFIGKVRDGRYWTLIYSMDGQEIRKIDGAAYREALIELDAEVQRTRREYYELYKTWSESGDYNKSEHDIMDAKVAQSNAQVVAKRDAEALVDRIPQLFKD